MTSPMSITQATLPLPVAPAEPVDTKGVLNAEEAQELLEQKKQTLKDFEGVFVSMLIKEMRKSAKDLFPGDATDSWGVMFDQHISDEITRGGGIGLAEQLNRYLEAEKL